MSFIDWSDPEEMLGLLVEYVADEAAASDGDRERARFLGRLTRELRAVEAHESARADRIEALLRGVIDSQPREFAGDAVMEHLEACADELGRIAAAHRRGGAPAP